MTHPFLSGVAVFSKSNLDWYLRRGATLQVDLYLWGECCIGKIGKAWPDVPMLVRQLYCRTSKRGGSTTATPT